LCDEKRDHDFNREHVIPQAYGTFGGATPVLHCVCTRCNTEFGRHFDEKIARDGIEAIDRVRVGLKNAADYRNLGKRSTTHVEFDKDSPMQGALGFHVPNPHGDGLAVTPMPQVGVARSAAGPFEWFPLSNLPTKEELIALGYERGPDVVFQTWGVPISEAQDALESKGFARGTVVSETQPPTGRIRTQIIARISDPELRGFSKIAFNYLAHVAGAAFVLRAEFNEIRRFVRYGVQVGSPPVEVSMNPWAVTDDKTGAPLVGHYVIVRTRDSTIEADVCLLMRLRYRITLARGGFLIPVAVSSGHLFDVQRQTALRMPSDHLPP
jgi:HNH endonuclease